MGKIVEKLGWKYLSIVYEESNYGIKVNISLMGLVSQNFSFTLGSYSSCHLPVTFTREPLL